MNSSKKVSSHQSNEIHVSPSPEERTKKGHLGIMMNDCEQKLIAMCNHDAESHDVNDLWSS